LEKESRGLQLLRSQDIFRIPAEIVCETARGRQVLILEWISQGPKTPAFWTLFGEQLARLHRVTAEFNQLQFQPSQHQPGITASSEPMASGSFGLSWDNYMGALPQSNTPTSRWTDFFIQQRLAPQVRLAARNDLLDSAHIRSFERLYPLLPGIFPEEAPSLLHGDLWSGNFLCDEHSRPVLIDPAVYFGHRSMDIAMTTLFGGFDPGFYEAYTYHFPFPSNYREQWEICNLYPLLIHLNLFGKSYQGSILHTIQRF
jgi:fructosamine-3-kinase